MMSGVGCQMRYICIGHLTSDFGHLNNFSSHVKKLFQNSAKGLFKA